MILTKVLWFYSNLLGNKHNSDPAHKLTKKKKSSNSAAEHAIEFRTVVAFCLECWDFILKEQIKLELAARDERITVEILISLAIRMDNKLLERRKESEQACKNHTWNISLILFFTTFWIKNQCS